MVAHRSACSSTSGYGRSEPVWRSGCARPVLKSTRQGTSWSAQTTRGPLGQSSVHRQYLQMVQWFGTTSTPGRWSSGRRLGRHSVEHRPAARGACAGHRLGLSVCDVSDVSKPVHDNANSALWRHRPVGLEAALAASGGWQPAGRQHGRVHRQGCEVLVGTGTRTPPFPRPFTPCWMQAAIAPFAAESSMVEIGSGHLADSQYPSAHRRAVRHVYLMNPAGFYTITEL